MPTELNDWVCDRETNEHTLFTTKGYAYICRQDGKWVYIAEKRQAEIWVTLTRGETSALIDARELCERALSSL